MHWKKEFGRTPRHSPPAPQTPAGPRRSAPDVPDPTVATPAAGGMRIAELDPKERRVAVAKLAGAVLIAWVLLIGAYYVHPGQPSAAVGAIVKMVVGVTVVVAVIVIEFPRIIHAKLPGLRAIEALGISLPLFFVVFSSVYLSLGRGPHPMFDMTLDHTKALYFAITVFSTVGFGDIVPTTDTARLLVAAQMLLDLVFIGAVVRILMVAATRGISKRT